MNYLIKQLKREYPWLKDADSTALTGTTENLHKAYTRFFKGQTRFPKFKSKKHEQSYISKCVNNNIVINTSAFQSRVPYTLKLENSLMDESVPLLSDRKHQENTKHLFFANIKKLLFQRQANQSALMLGSKILQFYLMARRSTCLALTRNPKNVFVIGKDLLQEGFCGLKRQWKRIRICGWLISGTTRKQGRCVQRYTNILSIREKTIWISWVHGL